MEFADGDAGVAGHYRYRQLDSQDRDIRLLTLLPGNPDEPIKVMIRHTSLGKRNESQWNEKLLKIKELRESLPKNTYAIETLDERYLFTSFRMDESANVHLQNTSWHHPDSSIDPSLYRCPDQAGIQAVQYEALSYTWGCQEYTEELTIIDQDSRPSIDLPVCKMSITRNLYDALAYLRKSTKRRTLWVDAVCINQEDISERDSQVARMREIFKAATGVVIWAGVAGDRSEIAIHAMDNLGKQMHYSRSLSQVFPDPEATEPTWFFAGTRLPFEDDIWASIRDFLDRAWFSRLWVIQEVQLANVNRATLQCGHDTMPWCRFRNALQNFRNNHFLPPSLHAGVNRASMICDDLTCMPLKYILWQTIGAMCSDDRDRIYALLGLMQPSLASRIRPQYSLPVSDVFQHACIEEIKFSNRPELFDLCYVVNRDVVQTSWIPDLTQDPPIIRILNSQFCTGLSSASFSFDEPNALICQGLKVSSISHCSDPFNGELGDIESIGRTASTWLSDRLHTSDDSRKSDLERQLLFALVDNRFKERYPDSPFPTQREWNKLIFPSTSPAFAGENGLQVKGSGTSHPTAICWTLERLDARCLFEMQNGSIGLGPPGCHPDDIVTVLLGCSTPIVVRPAHGGAFRVVGPCFAANLCDSIGLLGSLPEPWAVQSKLDDGSERYYYVNKDMGHKSLDDPRLEPLDGWEIIENSPLGLNPTGAAIFKYRLTGRTQTSDPRLSVDALKRRGVALLEIRLI